jgi:hypothetical protein
MKPKKKRRNKVMEILKFPYGFALGLRRAQS